MGRPKHTRDMTMTEHCNVTHLHRHDVNFLREYVMQAITLQHASLCGLMASLEKAPHEIADMFEDAANRYAELADLIREYRPIVRPSSA